MVSTFTTARNLEKVGRSDQVGVWDTPENSNWDIVDRGMGQATTISGAAGSVVLSGVQAESAQLIFNSTLLANITVTFPTSVTGRYAILHNCTGSSLFTITLGTTAAGGQVIGCPPGRRFEVWNDGVNLDYHNYGPEIGGYWDYAGSSVPNWVDACSPKKPYLNCDGSVISSAVYPVLTGQIGTTLPDARGRGRFAHNQGTGRITSSQTGVDGNTVGAAGGTVMISSQNLPTSAISDPGHPHQGRAFTGSGDTANPSGSVWANSAGFYNAYRFGVAANSAMAVGTTTTDQTGITFGSASPTGIVPPTYIGGLTMIRAA